VTLKQDFNVTAIFDAEYLRNGTRCRHSYNEILIGTYSIVLHMPYLRVLFRITLSDILQCSVMCSIVQSLCNS